YLDYAHAPYEFGNANFNRVAGIVDHHLTGNVVGSYAVLDWMSVGLVIPVYFWEGIRSTVPAIPNENNFDIGDIELVLKFRLLDREKHHVGIAILPFAYFPTSSGASDFLGNGSFAGGAKVVIDGRIKDRVSIALNVGYLARDRVFDIAGNELNDQLLMGLGISIDLLKDRLFLIGEAQMATVTSDFFTRRTTPAEARVGFRYTWANNHDINVGGGFGLSNGIGSPDYRLFAGYTYTKRPIAEAEVPPPPISEVNVGDELTAQDKIYFDFDKSTIRDISKPTLDKIAGFLKAHPEVTKIRIDGYTCDLGTDRYNLKLSQRRAASAATYLEGQGIDPSRIGAVTGYGEANPLVPNKDEPSREQNRRVQIFVEAVSK
ncbi:OmpA family protein, partial [bacterium]